MQATFNNTIVSITDPSGAVIAWEDLRDSDWGDIYAQRLARDRLALAAHRPRQLRVRIRQADLVVQRAHGAADLDPGRVGGVGPEHEAPVLLLVGICILVIVKPF